MPLHFFGSKSTISCFSKRFRDGQYSLVSFLFAVFPLTVPPCPAICKSGGTCPCALWSRRHFSQVGPFFTWMYFAIFYSIFTVFVYRVLGLQRSNNATHRENIAQMFVQSRDMLFSWFTLFRSISNSGIFKLGDLLNFSCFNKAWICNIAYPLNKKIYMLFLKTVE